VTQYHQVVNVMAGLDDDWWYLFDRIVQSKSQTNPFLCFKFISFLESLSELDHLQMRRRLATKSFCSLVSRKILLLFIDNIPIVVSSLRTIFNLCLHVSEPIEMLGTPTPDEEAKRFFNDSGVCDVLVTILSAYKESKLILALVFQCIAAMCPKSNSFTFTIFQRDCPLNLLTVLQNSKSVAIVVKEAIGALVAMTKTTENLSRFTDVGLLDILLEILDQDLSGVSKSERDAILSCGIGSILHFTRNCSPAQATVLLRLLQVLQKIAVSNSKNKEVKKLADDVSFTLKIKVFELNPLLNL